MIFAIDFDGTCVDHRYPEIGPDVPGAVDTMRNLINMDHKLILWTVRSGKPLSDAVQWFSDRGIFLSGINENPEQTEFSVSRKAYAHVYVDDAALGAPLVNYPGFWKEAIDWSVVGDKFLRPKKHN